jgi:AcrR family transcriptional regulator
MKDLETASEKPNRMARRRNKTRHNLMDAAIELILEKGYDDTLLEEIAETADVVQRTFYNHFDNKRDCVMAAITQRFGNYAEHYTSATEKNNDPVKAIAFIAMQMFNQIASDPITKKMTLYPRMLIEAILGSQLEFFREFITEGLNQKRLTPSQPIEILEPIISWGFVGFVINTIDTATPEDNKAEWAHFLLHSLGVENSEILQAIQAAKDMPSEK